MTDPNAITDPATLGRALYRLRRRADMSQEQAAEKLGITAVSWGKYEQARNKALTTPDLQERAAQALGFARDDLLSEAAQHLAGAPLSFDAPRKPAQIQPRMAMQVRLYGPEDDRGLFESAEEVPIDLAALISSPYLRSLRLPSDDIAPFAEQGSFVAYDLNGIPRKQQYVIVAMKQGSLIARRYEFHDEDMVHLSRARRLPDQGGLTDLWGLEGAIMRRSEIEAIWPIRMRGD